MVGFNKDASWYSFNGRISKIIVVLFFASKSNLQVIVTKGVDAFEMNRIKNHNGFSGRPRSHLSLTPTATDLEVIKPSYELAIGTLALESTFGFLYSALKIQLQSSQI